MCRAQKTSGAERETPRWRMDSIRQGTNARHTRKKLFLPSRSLRVMVGVAAVMACATAPPCSVSMRLSGSACVGNTSAPAMTALRSSFRGLAVSGSLHTSSSVRASCPGLAAQRTMAPIVAASGYKMKTHKAAAKRFKVTGSGKIVRRQACKAHLLRKKSTSRKKRLTGTTDVFRGDYDNVIGALPYLKVIR